MKSTAFSLCLLFVGSLPMLRADLPVEVRSAGFGALVLAEALPRAALAKVLDGAPVAPDGTAPTLWLRWADHTEAALDMEVTRLLPDGLLKVYTMSSTSPVLVPGERSGPATIVVRRMPAFAPDDWTLKLGEAEEKADLVAAFHARYGSGKKAEDLAYYRQAKPLTDSAASAAERQAAREAARQNPVPELRAAKSVPASLPLPVTLLQAGVKPGQGLLDAEVEDLAALPRRVQVPLGNYNYDLATIDVLDRPNELTVADARGLDLFALAQRQFGAASVAAVELMCYNGFTSTITAPGQGLLLAPADGDYAAALAAGEVIYASFEEPIIIALRQTGQSPAESASGVLAVNVLLK